MNEEKAKIFLIKNKLTCAEIARRVQPQSDANFKSLRSMISEMVNDKAWYPTLAEAVYREVGLRLVRPAHLKPRSSRQAA